MKASFLLLLLLLAACGADPVAPNPVDARRVLSISISPRLEPPPTIQDFIDAQNLAESAGAGGDFRSYTWSRLESTGGDLSYVDTVVRELTDEANRGVEILLGIQVLNTTAKETPADLLGTSFTNDAMKERFHRLLGRLLLPLSGRIRYLSIGNEVDVYLGSHSEEWSRYREFLEDAIAHVRGIDPRIRIGVTVTHGGLRSAGSTRILELATRTDVSIVTYYPLDNTFGVNAPTAPLADIPFMRRMAHGRPLVLQEVGYPSAVLLGSSEEKQSEFYRNLFDAWDAERAGIPFLNIFLLHDITHAMCEEFARYYGLPDSERFKAYLCSLGLRTSQGQSKKAWEMVRSRGRMVGDGE